VHALSYWQQDGWRDRWRDAQVPARVDFAIAGGGFAGLMTAIRLRELNPDATICVLEAERVGFGASGRNAGFLSPLAAPIWLLGAERSTEQAWGAAHINAEVHALAAWIAENIPACELEPVTLSLQAQSRLSEPALREFVRAVELVGLEHELRNSRARPGFSSLEMAAYTLHPYKLVVGLAELAHQRGVMICEGGRMRGLVSVRSGGATVDIDRDGVQSSLHATKLVLCTNAYSSSIALGERMRPAVVMHSYMAATSPLTEPLVRDAEFTVEVSTAQAYHRTHRGRLIYGGLDKLRASSSNDVEPRERSELATLMAASFPGAGLSIEHAWRGCFHATPTGLPIIRTSDENFALVYNVGYGGTGVALSLVCAKLAASVASNGRFASATGVDDTRLLGLIQSTRISVRDAARTVARIARGAAMPWLGV